MSFLGLSFTRSLKAEQADKAILEEERTALEEQKVVLGGEKAVLQSELTEAKGLNRFKVARIIIDLDYLESHLRNIVYPSLWLEVDTLGRKIVLVAYADKVLNESQANAVQAHFPTAERL